MTTRKFLQKRIEKGERKNKINALTL